MIWRDALRRHGKPLGLMLGLAALGAIALHAWRQRQAIDVVWQRADATEMMLAVTLGLGGQLMFGMAWHRLARQSGGAATWRQDLQYWGLSLLAKYLPGKVWQGLARIALYGDAANSAAVLTLFMREQLLSLGVATLFVAAVVPEGVPPPLRAAAQLILGCIGILMLAAATLRQLPRWVPVMFQRWSSLHAPDRVAIVHALLWNVAGYALLCAGFVLLARSLGLDDAGPAQLSAGLCFGGLAGVAAFFVPAGLGVREAGMLWYLGPALGTGPAAMLAIAARGWLLLAEVVVALAALADLRIVRRTRKPHLP